MKGGEDEASTVNTLNSLPVCRCRETAQWLPCHSMEPAKGVSGFLPRVSCCLSEQPVTEEREEGEQSKYCPSVTAWGNTCPR